MMEDAGEDVLRQRPNMVVTFFKRLGQVRILDWFRVLVIILPCIKTYQLMLDRWTPFTTSRWVATVILICAFMARILIAQVWVTLHFKCFSVLLNFDY